MLNDVWYLLSDIATCLLSADKLMPVQVCRLLHWYSCSSVCHLMLSCWLISTICYCQQLSTDYVWLLSRFSPDPNCCYWLIPAASLYLIPLPSRWLLLADLFLLTSTALCLMQTACFFFCLLVCWMLPTAWNCYTRRDTTNFSQWLVSDISWFYQFFSID